jgi:hypothetical protein
VQACFKAQLDQYLERLLATITKQDASEVKKGIAQPHVWNFGDAMITHPGISI